MARPLALRVTAARADAYRRTWRSSVATTFITPVLVLLAMGLGLGTLVDGGRDPQALGGLPYLDFLAPGLLAATAMQLAAGEAAWPVRLGMKWERTYHAALATPVRPRDLVVGGLLWTGVRVVLGCSVFALMMLLFGVGSPLGALLSLVPCALIGFAFAAPIMGYVAGADSDMATVSLFRFGVVPLFLFSGTFFPISQLPELLQPLAQATPLWHGVELTRAAVLGGDPAAGVLVHGAYLLVWAVGGTVLSVWLFGRKLRT
jgi:lipooligosaccharide transport system permease protein